jgi:phosphate transport system substrate-binding protein
MLACAGIILSVVGAARPDSGRPAAPVAIVVHPDTPVDDISFEELRRIFLGEQQFWSGGRTRVTLLVRPPRSSERAVILDRVYEMNEGQFRQYWIAKLFRAEVSSGPKIVYSNESALELVAAIPGAISFLDASVPTRSVKVLRIDGMAPGQRGYPLQ